MARPSATATARRTGDAGAVPGATDPPPRRQPGRPRDPRADQAILTAVVDLLAEVGFGGLTIDAVAHRAGVGKATIYRRWDGKEQLVLDALSTGAQQVAEPDTGTVRGDLLALYLPMGEPVAQQATVRLMPALAAEAAVNPELMDRLRAFVSVRRAPARSVVRRAVERGEVAAGTDADLAIDLIAGSLLYRLFFSGGEVDPGVIAEVVDVVLRGVEPGSTERR